MRILHTADWHLGKKLNEYIDLIEVQEDLLNQIQNILKEEEIDVFVLAGDIYQSIQVSDDAIRLLNEFLKETVRKFPQTLFLILNGNHDPAEKLNFGSELMIENLKIIAKLNEKHFPISISKNGTMYDFYPIPFYRVNEYRYLLSDSTINETKDIYKNILQKISINKNHKNILITHTAIDFMSKQERVDSEEDTYGNVGLVPSEIFFDFDLVLLGHYHKHQKFEKNIYYSGSIYKYSASEHNNKKGVLIHDLKEETHQFIELSPKKNLHYIVGTFQEIITKIHKQFNKHQTENDYFYIELDEKNLISYVKDELSRYYKNIVNISYKNEDIFSNTSKININHKEINQLNEIELFKKFLEYLYSDEEDQNLDDVLYEQTGFKKQELLDTYQELWEEFRKHQN